MIVYQALRRALVFIIAVSFFIVMKNIIEKDPVPYVHKEFRGPQPRLNTRQTEKHVSILCLVLTTEGTSAKLKAVNETWGKRCDKTLFFADKQETMPDVVYLDSVRKGRRHLTEKVIKAFEYVQINYANYDWYLKADDDTYVILDNLRVLLSYFNARDPVYLGQNFKYFTKQGFHSGGAGYVISKEAFNRLLFGVKDGQCKNDGNNEDVDIAVCLDSQGVVAYDTTDRFHRETFHAGAMEEHIVGPKSQLLLQYPSTKAQFGRDCCSTLTISFHYVQPPLMYIVDMLLYHVTVYEGNSNASLNVFESNVS